MNFLVIGSGAREHIIGEKIVESGGNLYSVLTNRNPGLLKISRKTVSVSDYSSSDSKKIIIDFAKTNDVECVVIGPEDPLANGFADMFMKIGISTVGPVSNLAQIETSKGFTRDLLSKYGIDCSPRYQRFSSLSGVSEFLDLLSDDFVVKYDGLMGGKGVKVSGEHLHSHDEALAYCEHLISNSGTFVVEEKIFGEEFSLMSFCDGNKLIHMPAVQDHKRAYEGDLGPNTGGMGSYSDANHSLPFLLDQEVREAQEINERVATSLKEEFGVGYKGILYGGFMATKDGAKLIEYNARFGDPEAMNLLSLLDTDFAKICFDIGSGNLEIANFRKEASVCKYIVPEGYGSSPNSEATLVVDEAYNEYSNLYYAAVNLENDDTISTTSSRAAGIVSTGESLSAAEDSCEMGLSKISGKNLFVRHDIAKADLIQKRIDNMENIRS